MPQKQPYSDTLFFYGRRKGRMISKYKQLLLGDLLPKLDVLSFINNPIHSSNPLRQQISESNLNPDKRTHIEHSITESHQPNPEQNSNSLSFTKTKLFPKVKTIWLEIGFGNGEHLIDQAKQHPDIGFIGVEPFLNGIANILAHIDKLNLKNIYLHHGLIQEILPYIPDHFFSRIFILFPDPWSKLRHAKRRLVSEPFAINLARILCNHGILRIASDIFPYFDTVIPNLLNQNNFSLNQTHYPVTINKDFIKNEIEQKRSSEIYSSLNIRKPDWITTRYEQRALKAGRNPVYLEFVCQKG